MLTSLWQMLSANSANEAQKLQLATPFHSNWHGLIQAYSESNDCGDRRSRSAAAAHSHTSYRERGRGVWINNKRRIDAKFSWQRGCGAFSVRQLMADKVKRNIENQIEHHRNQIFCDELLFDAAKASGRV
jgi:hypothetical protein